MRSLIITLLALASIFASAQEPPKAKGTVVIINISEHRTGKMDILCDKQSLVKLGQHQWAEIELPVGVHVLAPKIQSEQRAVINVEPNTKHYVIFNFIVFDVEFREVTLTEGEHWINEYGTNKRVQAPKK